MAMQLPYAGSFDPGEGGCINCILLKVIVYTGIMARPIQTVQNSFSDKRFTPYVLLCRDGGQLLSSNSLIAHGNAHMQELNMENATCPNKEIFQQHPLALLRLATFVRDAADVARTGKRIRTPVVVVGPSDADGFCRVLGIRQGTTKNQLQVRL